MSNLDKELYLDAFSKDEVINYYSRIGPGATIVECCRLAERLREILVADGLTPVAETSGPKGTLYRTKEVAGIGGVAPPPCAR